jgi:hypothetical protein
LLLAALAVALGTPLLMSRPPQMQAAFLAAVVGIGVCEVLGFGYIVLAVSLGIPAAPWRIAIRHRDRQAESL